MSLSVLLLALLLILLAINWLAWVAVSVTFLGIVALVDGILFLIEGFAPLDYRIGPRRTTL